MSSTDAQVLVVGGGPSGLVLALTLANNGIPVRIIDKETSHRVGAKGTAMAPRSLELYGFLGMLPDITKLACAPPPRRIYASPDGIVPIKTWYLTEYAEPTPAFPIMNPLKLGQAYLEGVMRDHLQQRFGISVELGTELASFEQNEDYVTAHLVKHAEGDATETIKVPYIVGCDGGKSNVRKQLGLSFLGQTREEEWILFGDVEVKGVDRDHWHTWGDKGSKLVSIRPPDAGCPYFPFMGGARGMSTETVQAMARDPKLVEEFFREVSGRQDIEFGHWQNLTAYRPNIRMADGFSKGRVFIAGDAAHTHSPTGGQGLNSSVQDSFNLAWKLALVLKGLSPSSLLETYSEERLPVIAEMLQRTTAILDKSVSARVTQSPSGASFDESPFRREKVLYQLGVNYRWSSIVRDERVVGAESEVVQAYGGGDGGAVRAGDRAPDASGLQVIHASADAQVGVDTKLFDIFKPSVHTMLLFLATSDDAHLMTEPSIVEAIASEVPSQFAGKIPLRTVAVLRTPPPEGIITSPDLVLVDKEGHAFTGYAIPPEPGMTAVIVRPDGVIGAIVKGKQGVEDYFKGVFLS